MKELGIKPNRTIRVVMWTNEENGTRGGRGYLDAHRAELGKHVAAIESDNGVFSPTGFHFPGSDAGLAAARAIAPLMDRIKATKMEKGGGEADVGPMISAGVPGFALNVDDTRYFWFHHSDGDTMDVINPDEFRRCIGAMAVVLAYALAGACHRAFRGKWFYRACTMRAQSTMKSVAPVAENERWRFSAVRNLIAHPFREHKAAAVAKLRFEFAGETEENVPFLAPMICEVAGRVLDHPHANRPEVASAPERGCRFHPDARWGRSCSNPSCQRGDRVSA